LRRFGLDLNLIHIELGGLRGTRTPDALLRTEVKQGSKPQFEFAYVSDCAVPCRAEERQWRDACAILDPLNHVDI